MQEEKALLGDTIGKEREMLRIEASVRLTKPNKTISIPNQSSHLMKQV
jgi:hypothetical protein